MERMCCDGEIRDKAPVLFDRIPCPSETRAKFCLRLGLVLMLEKTTQHFHWIYCLFKTKSGPTLHICQGFGVVIRFIDNSGNSNTLLSTSWWKIE